MGYLTAALLACVLSLLRCIYLKVWPVARVGQDKRTITTGHDEIDVSVVVNAVCDISVPPPAWTDRTRDNNKTLDKSRVFEEV